ncbi:hypothetical protein An08g02610 [Aspergillus niger]|uniref:Uncharacterized protein n=2 Tax=Aspergillus niger TaxID=5061 RepID=A2QQI1_ASPNC|nr:hypothetical protein An08g02610 [Aspergillus niger]CAK45297.1 hypothetical protein An08g02610 [Aspergillus niger]
MVSIRACIPALVWGSTSLHTTRSYTRWGRNATICCWASMSGDRQGPPLKARRRIGKTDGSGIDCPRPINELPSDAIHRSGNRRLRSAVHGGPRKDGKGHRRKVAGALEKREEDQDAKTGGGKEEDGDLVGYCDDGGRNCDDASDPRTDEGSGSAERFEQIGALQTGVVMVWGEAKFRSRRR